MAESDKTPSSGDAGMAMVRGLPLDLFPTRIWTYEAPGLKALCAAWAGALLQRLDSLERDARSLRGGWASEPGPLDETLFPGLQACLREAVTRVFEEHRPTRELNFEIQAWAVVQEAGAFNLPHLHPRSLLSGVFYLQVPPGSGKLVFRDPRPGAVVAGFPGRGIHCQPNVLVEPAVGRLLLFPNWLEHYVEPSQAEQPRVSIAFNAVRGSGSR